VTRAEMQKRRSFYAPPLAVSYAAKYTSYRLVMFAATMRSATAAVRRAGMRCCGVRRTMGRATMRCGSVGRIVGATTRSCGMDAATTTVGAYCRCASSTIGCIGTSTTVSTGAGVVSSAVPSSAATAEAMSTPAVAIAPVRPRTHAEENAVIEIARPIKAHGGAAVR
jgi:hypothetical protein